MDNVQNQAQDTVKIGTLKRNYNLALLVLTGVLVGSMVWLSLHPTEWAFVFLPLLGGVGAALLWLAIARFFFCRDAARLLAPSFKTPIQLALIAPAWGVCTMVLLAIPSDTSGWDDDLASALALLMTLLFLLVFVVGVVVLAVLSIYKGYRHKKEASALETPAYRNAPFAVSIALFLATLGVAGLFLMLPVA